MEKLLFVFSRKDGLTRDEFFDHYLTVHAPLGLELTKTLVRYAVNLHDGRDRAPENVDAFTETWTDSIADFMNVDTSFATPEDAAAVDDRSRQLHRRSLRRVRGRGALGVGQRRTRSADS